MKKELLLFSAAITLWSCSKEIDTASTAQDKNQQATGAAIKLASLSSKQVIKEVRAFEQMTQTIANGHQLKTNNQYTVDEAVWYLEAALNYEFRHPSIEIQHHEVDSSFLTVSNFTVDQEGKLVVDDASLATAYLNLEQALQAMLSSQEDIIEAVDVYVHHINNYNVTFGVNTLIINGMPYNPQPLCFQTGEDWYAAWDLGMCNGSFQYQLDGHDMLARYYTFNYLNNFTLAFTNQHAIKFYTNVLTVNDRPDHVGSDMGAPSNPCQVGDCSGLYGHVNDPNGYVYPNSSPTRCLTAQELNNYFPKIQLWVSTAQNTLATQGYMQNPSLIHPPATRDLINIELPAFFLLIPNVDEVGTSITARFGTAHTL